MRKNKLMGKLALGILIAALVLQLGFITYSMVGKNQDNYSVSQNIIDNKPQNTSQDAIADNVDAKKVNTTNSLDTSKAKVPQEVQGAINKYDSENTKSDMNMYKKLSSRLEIPVVYLKEIENMVKKGYEFRDIMIAFDFLNHNYGFIKELEPLLQERKSNKDWSDIFVGYNKNHKEFVPGEFKNGYLEEIMSKYKSSTDDIMIADRLSQKGLGSFEDFIKKRAGGEQWEKINESLGIVNISAKLPRVSLTNAQIDKVLDGTDLSEDKAIEALVVAKQMNMDSASVVKQYDNKEKKEDIYENCYTKMYK